MFGSELAIGSIKTQVEHLSTRHKTLNNKNTKERERK